MSLSSAKTEKRTDLLVPVNDTDVLIRIEGKRIVATGRKGEWVKLVGGALAKGEPHTFTKKSYTAVVTRHTLPERVEAEVVVQKKSEGKFKVAAHGHTSAKIVRMVAEAIGEPATITEEEQHGKPVARGVRKGYTPGGRSKTKVGIKVVALADENEDHRLQAGATPEDRLESRSHSAEAPAKVDHGPVVSGEEARAALKQTCTIVYLEGGIKVRIVGKKADAEAVCGKIIAGSPTLTTPKGSKFQIEGNLKKSYSEKSSGITPPDAQGVRTRDDPKERTFSAWGDNLAPVKAAAEAQCREGTVFTVVIATRIVAAGTRKQR